METKKKKPTIFTRVKNWAVDNAVEITFVVTIVGTGAACFIMGKDLGHLEGLEEFRKEHVRISKHLIDGCGYEGAFAALDYIRGNKDAYDTLMENPREAIENIYDLYYNHDAYIKELVDFYNK